MKRSPERAGRRPRAARFGRGAARSGRAPGARLLASLACGAALLAVSVAARAADRERIAVFPLDGLDLPKEVEMAPYGLTTFLSRRMEKAGFAVVEPKLALRDMVVALSCEHLDQECAAKIATNEKVSRVVVGELAGTKSPAKLVRVRIRVFRADGAPMREVDELVPGTVAELTGSFERVTAIVLVMMGAAAPPGGAPPGAATTASSPAGGGAAEGAASFVHPRGPRLTTVLGISALGAGVVAAAVGGVFGLRWLGAHRDFNAALDPYRGPDGLPDLPASEPFPGVRDLCADGGTRLTPGAAADLESRGAFDACRRLKASALLGWVLAGAGAALLGTGGALLVLGRPASGGGGAGGAGVSAAPTVVPGGAGLVVEGRF
ncbi:MAG TPA: hypothetical protein VG389_12345 [Myxococcota bacterium]|nr:hypothetical protein [Myxococcota bacterium]